jgi:hypothetical protein
MITINTISPRPPLGPYPQLRLYGQAGTAPNNRIISKTSRIIPMTESLLQSFVFRSAPGTATTVPQKASVICRLSRAYKALVPLSIAFVARMSFSVARARFFGVWME